MDNTMQLIWTISWQAALAAAVVWAISRVSGRAPAAWRYALWVVVLVKFLVPPFVHITLPTDLPKVEAVNVPAETYMMAGLETPGQAQSAAEAGGAAAVVAPRTFSMPGTADLAASAWVLGIVFMAGRIAIRSRRTSKLITSSLPASALLEGLAVKCAGVLGMKHVPKVRVSQEVCTPMLVGLRDPIVMLPSDITDACSEADLSAILMHELAHVRRRDLLVSWAQQAVQAVFFFHPALWLVGRELRRERELACDELVLAAGADRRDYASGYLSALKLANREVVNVTALAMAEPFDIEKRRLRMILNNSVPKTTARWAAAFLIIAVLALPTFAGIVPSKLSPAEAEDLLTELRDGTKAAYAAIQTGKGKAKISQWRKSDDGLWKSDPWGRSEYITFSGEKYKNIHVPGDPESYLIAMVYDGETMKIYNSKVRKRLNSDPYSAEWKLFKTHEGYFVDKTTDLWRCVTPLKDPGKHSYGGPDKTFEYEVTDQRIIGTEKLDGMKCIVVETRADYSSEVRTSVSIERNWICPDAGYSTLRLQVGRLNPDGEFELIMERNTKVRNQGGGVWVIERMENVVNLEAMKKNMEGVSNSKTFDFMPSKIISKYDFEYNVPLTDDDLTIKTDSD